MAFTETLTDFINPNDFGDTVTYIQEDGIAVEIVGIYTDETIFDSGAAEVGEQASQPTLECKTSDVPFAGHDDIVIVSGQPHTVVGVEKGFGMTVLTLEKTT